MFSLTLPRRMSALITAASLVPLLIAGFMTSAPAYADTVAPPDPTRIIICRTDPIVFLSDGTQVKLTAQISTAAQNVQGIVYNLHAPVGTTVTRVVYMGQPVPEHLNFVADMAAGTYDTDTVVAATGNNGQGPIRVTVTTVVDQGNSGSATGVVGDHLWVHIR